MTAALNTVQVDALSGDEFDYALARAFLPQLQEITLTECGCQAIDVMFEAGEVKVYRRGTFAPSRSADDNTLADMRKALRKKFPFGVVIPSERGNCLMEGHKTGHICELGERR